MQRKFKKGDKVRCINPDSSGRLKKEAIYIFHGYDLTYNNEILLEGSPLSFFEYRFVLVSRKSRLPKWF